MIAFESEHWIYILNTCENAEICFLFGQVLGRLVEEAVPRDYNGFLDWLKVKIYIQLLHATWPGDCSTLTCVQEAQ